MSTLTAEEKRERIAVACGWRLNQPGPNIAPDGREIIHAGMDPFAGVPDYFHDLNTMAEAEKVLDGDGYDGDGIESQKSEYAHLLYYEMTGQRRNGAIFHCWYYLATATAAQRAEAFGRTLKLWT